MKKTQREADRPAVAMDPSSSIGLGHLMRLACLRETLGITVQMLGGVDARLGAGGLRLTRRQTVQRPAPRTRVVIVDRNYIDSDILAWRLESRRNHVIWVRRGLLTTSQSIAQCGFLAFADLVISLGDVGEGHDDPLRDLADRQGKLRSVGICHAYQVVRRSDVARGRTVFMSLGAFDEPLRPSYLHIRDLLTAAGIPVLWSSYSDLPVDHGFSVSGRIGVSDALRVKSECAALVSEGGYNSLHEASFLARPALLIPNDANGRELQSLRVRAAMQLSPLLFDASSRNDVEDWLVAASENTVPSENARTTHGIAGSGFTEMARIVEEFCADRAN